MAEKLRSGNTIISDSAERTLDFLFAQYLNAQPGKPTRLSETDVGRISESLRRIGKDSWAKVPRLYAVLRLVNNLQCIDNFLAEGVSDIWFPFTPQTLPETLRSATARSRFLELQDLVLTKAFDLEREDGRHRHFSDPEDIPLRKLEELGRGGFGSVDRVLSTITYREYARKLIPKGRNYRKNSDVLKDFERELRHLKNLSHIHIVKFVGSYTDPRFVGLLMSPVADYNLRDFLARGNLTAGERSFLRTFYGCMAAALCYLHEKQVRHKDIKPQNVLVKGHQVYLTDFGTSLDWSDLGQSTTSGITVHTPRYCAPEVAQRASRNSLSDIWSLGCVFLEAWTVLKGRTINDLIKFLSTVGTGSTCYHLNQRAALQWCDSIIAGAQDIDEDAPIEWIHRMLLPDSDQRWTAQALWTRIQEAEQNPAQRYAFIGTCCAYQDYSSACTLSSRRSVDVNDTGNSSIGLYTQKLASVDLGPVRSAIEDAPATSRLSTPEITENDISTTQKKEQAREHQLLPGMSLLESPRADEASNGDTLKVRTLSETSSNNVGVQHATLLPPASSCMPTTIFYSDRIDQAQLSRGEDLISESFLPSSASIAHIRTENSKYWYIVRVLYQDGQIRDLSRTQLDFVRLSRNVATVIQERYAPEVPWLWGYTHARIDAVESKWNMGLHLAEFETFLKEMLWLSNCTGGSKIIPEFFVPRSGLDHNVTEHRGDVTESQREADADVERGHGGQHKILDREGVAKSDWDGIISAVRTSSETRRWLKEEDSVIEEVTEKRKDLLPWYQKAFIFTHSRTSSRRMCGIWYLDSDVIPQNGGAHHRFYVVAERSPWFDMTVMEKAKSWYFGLPELPDSRSRESHRFVFWHAVLGYALAKTSVSYMYRITSSGDVQYICQVSYGVARGNVLLAFEVRFSLTPSPYQSLSEGKYDNLWAHSSPVFRRLRGDIRRYEALEKQLSDAVHRQTALRFLERFKL